MAFESGRPTLWQMIGWSLIGLSALGAFVEFSIFEGRHDPWVFDGLVVISIVGLALSFVGASHKMRQHFENESGLQDPNIGRIFIFALAAAMVLFMFLR